MNQRITDLLPVFILHYHRDQEYNVLLCHSSLFVIYNSLSSLNKLSFLIDRCLMFSKPDRISVGANKIYSAPFQI